MEQVHSGLDSRIEVALGGNATTGPWYLHVGQKQQLDFLFGEAELQEWVQFAVNKRWDIVCIIVMGLVVVGLVDNIYSSLTVLYVELKQRVISIW